VIPAATVCATISFMYGKTKRSQSGWASILLAERQPPIQIPGAPTAALRPRPASLRPGIIACIAASTLSGVR